MADRYIPPFLGSRQERPAGPEVALAGSRPRVSYYDSEHHVLTGPDQPNLKELLRVSTWLERETAVQGRGKATIRCCPWLLVQEEHLPSGTGVPTAS